MIKTLEESINSTRKVLTSPLRNPCPPGQLLPLRLSVLGAAAALSAHLGTRDEVHAAFLELARELGLTGHRHFWIDVRGLVHYCGPHEASNVISDRLNRVYEEMEKDGIHHP